MSEQKKHLTIMGQELPYVGNMSPERAAELTELLEDVSMGRVTFEELAQQQAKRERENLQ